MKHLVLLSGAGALLAMAACGSTAPASPSATSTAARSAATPVTAAQSVLVFTRSHGSPSSSIVTTFRRLDGTAINTITSSNSDSTFDLSVSNNNNYIGYSQALLSSDELYPPSGGVTVTKWAVIGKDGTSHPLPSSLTQFLNQVAPTGDTPRILAGVFLVGGDTLFAGVSSSSGSVDYDRVDLASGEVTTLFTANQTSTAQFYAFLPENITPSGSDISFLAANATVMNHTVQGLAVVTYNVATGAIAVHQLPDAIAAAVVPSRAATAWAPATFVSPDGGLVIYQSTATANGAQVFTTHVYHVVDGRDVTVPARAGIAFTGGANSVFFSPDNGYAALLGGGASGGQKMVVVSTATGTTVKTVGVSDPSRENVTPMGWTSGGALVYVTIAATLPGSFNPENGVTHSLDPVTGQVHDYPANFGELIAVLY